MKALKIITALIISVGLSSIFYYFLVVQACTSQEGYFSYMIPSCLLETSSQTIGNHTEISSNLNIKLIETAIYLLSCLVLTVVFSKSLVKVGK